eukprot:TRINITY_DN2342_c0_g1_i2.p1 TRINITY_DN2342_c0_g1~~TRINITY_DN2342_c0_g1_i2.p1  ORF type:complete len:296 (+),score=52.47 TRINITY_DN2342_c0_g1_i2:77-889(+)
MYQEMKKHPVLYSFLGVGAVMVSWAASYSIFYYSHREPVPIEGIDRKQFVYWAENGLPPQEFIAKMDTDVMEMLQKQNSEFLSPDSFAYKRVMSILVNLLKNSDEPELNNKPFKLFLVNNPDICTCMVTPNRSIFFFTGLFNIIHRNDEIAAILAHELGHVVARHHKEMMSSLGFLVSKQHKDFKHSRLMEYEADYAGILLLAKALYNPEAAIRLMKALDGIAIDANTPNYEYTNMTHPTSKSRTEYLTSYLPEARYVYETSRKKKQKYH